MMEPMSTIEFFSVWIQTSFVISLYTNLPTKIAYTHAKEPTSDGVNRPRRIPTSRSTGKITAQIHSFRIPIISLNEARSSRMGLKS